MDTRAAGMETERFDVVVVGAGWNGLINAKTYLDFVPDANLVILDQQATIGGVWSKANIYPSLYAQVKIGQFEYSFYPMRHENVTGDGYIGAETVHAYLNEFARDFNLLRRTRLSTRVARVEREHDSGLWRLQIETEGVTRLVETRRLIFASGPVSHPVMPRWPSTDDFAVPTIHSASIGQHVDALRKVERATVVGAAKSAYDVVFLLLSQGVRVDWLIREEGGGPMAILPPSIGPLNVVEVAATELTGSFSACIMRTTGPAYHMLHRSRLGRAFTAAFWRCLTAVAASYAGYTRSPNAGRLKPVADGAGFAFGIASVPDFWKVFHAGDCTVHRTEVASLGAPGRPNRILLRNGESIDTNFLVVCTGYDKSYHQFDPALQEMCGLVPPTEASEMERWAALQADAELTVDTLLPALARPNAGMDVMPSDVQPPRPGDPVLHGPNMHYRWLVVPKLAAQGDRSVFFPGFIHTFYTPLVSEVQALWGVAFMLGLLDLPTRHHMEREVAVWNTWSRKRYGLQGLKNEFAIFDFWAYIEVLLRDLGIKTARKSNPITEFFWPKYPRDYRGLVDEFKTVLAQKHPRGYKVNGHA